MMSSGFMDTLNYPFSASRSESHRFPFHGTQSKLDVSQDLLAPTDGTIRFALHFGPGAFLCSAWSAHTYDVATFGARAA
jgi:hypothetical protein